MNPPPQKFCSIIPLEAEGLPHTICCYLHIPSPQPHLRVPFASFRPAVPDEPPLWNVHYTHVAAGQWLPSLLDHRYPIPEGPEYKIFTQPPRTVLHRRAAQYRTYYRLEYPGEEHHICGWSLLFIINPLCLGDEEYMLTWHVLFEIRLRYNHSTQGILV